MHTVDAHERILLPYAIKHVYVIRIFWNNLYQFKKMKFTVIVLSLLKILLNKGWVNKSAIKGDLINLFKFFPTNYFVFSAKYV